MALEGEALTLRDGETLLCEARAGSVAHLSPPPPPIDWDDVMRRGEVGGAPDDGEFSRCIVCGRERAVGDGLRVLGTAGPQAGYSLSCYVPHPNHADEHGRIRPEFVWGTLDCPGAFAVQDPDDFRPALTGRMTAQVIEPPKVGERCAVVGWKIGEEGRQDGGVKARNNDNSRVIVAVAPTVGEQLRSAGVGDAPTQGDALPRPHPWDLQRLVQLAQGCVREPAGRAVSGVCSGEPGPRFERAVDSASRAEERWIVLLGGHVEAALHFMAPDSPGCAVLAAGPNPQPAMCNGAKTSSCTNSSQGLPAARSTTWPMMM